MDMSTFLKENTVPDATRAKMERARTEESIAEIMVPILLEDRRVVGFIDDYAGDIVRTVRAFDNDPEAASAIKVLARKLFERFPAQESDKVEG